MTGTAGGRSSALAPDEAFSALGNETRMEILRTLGEADEPLSFSTLRDRVGMRDSGQFNYHLDELEGHFVRKTDDGYALRQAGRRVIEAVLSGAVTEAPVVEPAEVDIPCLYCDSPIAVSFREESVRAYCTGCDGTYGDAILVEDPSRAAEVGDSDEYGFLGEFPLPPAGVQGRSPAEMQETAFVWGTLQLLTAARGVCPRCAARVEASVSVCADHDPGDGVCERCDFRYAVMHETHCTNCLYEERAPFMVSCLAEPDVIEFLTARDLDPLGNLWFGDWELDEEVLSTDPFEARFTWTVGEDSLTVTVGDDLTVTVTEREEGASIGRNETAEPD